jgi:hypothetical protein
MIRLIFTLAGALSIALCRTALAQPAPTESEQKLENTVLPDVSIGKASLNEVVDVLRKMVPTWNVVIIRKGGLPADYPIVPAMQIKNATLGQVLVLLRSSNNGVNIQPIDGPNGPLYVIHVDPVEDPVTVASGVVIHSGVSVKVYYLSDVLLGMETHGKSQLQAMDDLASLISQTLDEDDEKLPSEIKIHAATNVLIFKGGPEKMEVLDQLIQSLTPSPEQISDQRYNELQRQLHQKDVQIDIMKDTIKTLDMKFLSSAATRP